jgi:hypothetical protein
MSFMDHIPLGLEPVKLMVAAAFVAGFCWGSLVTKIYYKCKAAAHSRV